MKRKEYLKMLKCRTYYFKIYFKIFNDLKETHLLYHSKQYIIVYLKMLFQ